MAPPVQRPATGNERSSPDEGAHASRPPAAGRILIADDNPSIHADFREILAVPDEDGLDGLDDLLFDSSSAARGPAFTLDSAYQGQEAVTMARDAVAAGEPYAVCFLDIRMPPGWDGPDTLARLWEVDPDLQVVFCTAYSDYSWQQIIDRFGYTDQLLILKKPFEVSEVRQLAHALAEKWRLARESRRRLSNLEEQVTRRTRALRREMAERNRAERQLQQAQRLQALGRLAAGVGHEINNPLSFIIGSIEVVQATLAELDADIPEAARRELAELLDAALVGGDRIAQIVRNIKTFIRPAARVTEAVDIAAAIDLSLQMVAKELGAHIEVKRDLADTPPVAGNRGELEQVFTNLLKNAAHALTEQPPRAARIHVSSRCDAGGQVEVEIRDTGPGLDQKTIDRVFDPFFTTKPVDQGTGLGLSICHAIVSAMGGDIEVRNADGGGAAVTVRLPAMTEMPAPASGGAAAHAAGDVDAEAAVARILIVDDEPLLLRTMMHALSGHEVAGLTSARQALARCASETFDIILCDIMMPDMSGMDLYRALARSHPGLEERIVFITGGATLDEVRAFLEDIPNPCIEKPVERRQLEERVDEILRQRRP